MRALFYLRLTVKRNAQNMMQYIRSKHKDRVEPSISEMREAGVNASVREEKSLDVEKDPIDERSSAFFTDNTNSATEK